MKEYPDVWLTLGELANIIRDWDRSKIPTHLFRKGFLSAQARALSQVSQGKRPEWSAHANWLLGFIKGELMEEAIKEARLKKIGGADVRE